MASIIHPHEKRKIRLLQTTLAVGILLMLFKTVAWIITGSNAILTDAAESLVNIAAGGFALYSVSLAAKPRDAGHPYGHGKIEFLSAGLEGLLILVAGLAMAGKSIYNLLEPTALTHLDTGIIISVFAGAANLTMGLILINNGRKWNSITITSDGKHLLSDAWTSAGLVAGLAVIYFTGLHWLDSLIAVLFGLLLIWSGYKLLRKSVSGVMDEADKKLVQQVIRILNENREEDWIDFHNLRIIQYGSNLHIDCHMTLPWYYELKMVHHSVDKIEALVNSEMSTSVELFIHTDPCVPSSCPLCEKSDCAVRQHPYVERLEWRLENVIGNHKHRMEHLSKDP
ncbi:MAG: cation diffusion facilitator family transporter [Bacteroidia bacterium]